MLFKIKIRVYALLERALRGFGYWIVDRANCFAICTTCGRNRFNLKPCPGREGYPHTVEKGVLYSDGYNRRLDEGM